MLVSIGRLCVLGYAWNTLVYTWFLLNGFWWRAMRCFCQHQGQRNSHEETKPLLSLVMWAQLWVWLRFSHVMSETVQIKSSYKATVSSSLYNIFRLSMHFFCRAVLSMPVTPGHMDQKDVKVWVYKSLSSNLHNDLSSYSTLYSVCVHLEQPYERHNIRMHRMTATTVHVVRMCGGKQH